MTQQCKEFLADEMKLIDVLPKTPQRKSVSTPGMSQLSTDGCKGCGGWRGGEREAELAVRMMVEKTGKLLV